MTDAVSDEYLELVVDIHDRQFQKYSIENSIYHIPVDEVRRHFRPACCCSRLFSSQAGKRHNSSQLHVKYVIEMNTESLMMHRKKRIDS